MEKKKSPKKIRYVKEKRNIDQYRTMSTKLPEMMGNLMIGYLNN